MNIVKIDQYNVENYREIGSSSLKIKFYQDISRVHGVVSPVAQEISHYFDEFIVHRFTLSTWCVDEDNSVSAHELTIYRLVEFADKEKSVVEIAPLSYVNLSAHLAKKTNCALFVEGDITIEAPSERLVDSKNELEQAARVFKDLKLELASENKYHAKLSLGDNEIESSFQVKMKTGITNLLLKAYTVIASKPSLQTRIEHSALEELFELKQQGWFYEPNLDEQDFVNLVSKGHIRWILFEDRKFSIWYSVERLFPGEQIILENNYGSNKFEIELFGNDSRAVCDGEFNKKTLMQVQRPSITTEKFGKLVSNARRTTYSTILPWLDTKADVWFTPKGGAIDKNQLSIAESVFDNQEQWNNLASEYATDKYLNLKNDSWREDGEPVLSKEEFKALLGPLLISFGEDRAYDFNFHFETDDRLFAGHTINISGSLENGFTTHELIG